MDWIVSKIKDFVGRRSLTRADMASPERKQLVGLLTRDPAEVLPEGAHLVERALPKPAMTMLGHVTTSHWSPQRGRCLPPALLKGRLGRKGQTAFPPQAAGPR